MKLKRKMAVFVVFLLGIVCTYAQEKTVFIQKAGTLGSHFTLHEPYLIRKLTIQGTIDARDFLFMRNHLPELEELDLRETQIVSYYGEGGSVFGKIEYYPAGEIPEKAFYAEEKGVVPLQQIFFPKTLTSIGNNAFQNCIQLEGVVFPESIQSIGSYAFSGCEKISGLVFPQKMNLIQTEAFSGCRKIETIVFPKELIYIADRAFMHCTSLTEVLFPEELEEIGEGAFAFCDSVKRVHFPAALVNIGKEAFQRCSLLSALYFPQGLSSIGDYAFMNCRKLNTIHFSPTISSIGEGAFMNCNLLTSVVQLKLLPPKISNSVFAGIDLSYCSLEIPTASLKRYKEAETWESFQILEGGLVVEATANHHKFGHIEGLKKEFYKKRELINLRAVAEEGCRFVNWTNRRGRPISTKQTVGITLSRDTSIVAHFKPDIQAYTLKAGTLKYKIGDKKHKIQHLILKGELDARDFVYMRDSLPFLSSLNLREAQIVPYKGNEGTIPGKEHYYRANEIPDYAFFGKTSIETILFSGKTAHIGNFSFSGCVRLSKVEFPYDLFSIGRAAFQNAMGLTYIYLPPHIAYIGSKAFYQCNSVKTIILTSADCSIESDALDMNLKKGARLVMGSGYGAISKNNDFLSLPSFSIVDILNPSDIQNTWEKVRGDSLRISESMLATIDVKEENLPKVSLGGISVDVVSNAAPLGLVRGLENRFYKTKERLTLTAVPKNGSRFVNWTSQEGKLLSHENPYRIILSKDTAIRANFRTDTLLISLKAGTLKEKIRNKKNKAICLVLKGEMDARDFQYIRDSLSIISYLDLRDIEIVAYTGIEGSCYGIYLFYEEGMIPSYAFAHEGNGKPSLQKIFLPKKTNKIGEYAFSRCQGLQEISLSDHIRAIEQSAFSGCVRLTQVVLPQSLCEIGEAAFYGSGILEVDLPMGLKKLEQGTFSGCENLSQIRLYSAMEFIAKGAFDHCPNLRDLFMLNPNPPVFISGWNKEFYTSCNVWVPTYSAEAYKQSEGWKDFSLVEEKGIVVSVLVNNSLQGEIKGLEDGFFQLDERLTLEAVAFEGYRFVGWEWEGEPFSKETSISFQVTDNRCLKAYFEKESD